MNKGARHRQMVILGMLLDQPMYGHQIKETIDVHMESFSDLKRANLYYLLDQLAQKAFLERRVETMADAAKPGEREMYYITPAGRAYFQELLRETLSSFEGVRSPIDVAIFFLPHLPRAEAIDLLDQRRMKVKEGYDRIAGHRNASPEVSEIHDIATDHLMMQYSLEMEWLDRTRDKLQNAPVLQPLNATHHGRPRTVRH